MRLQRFAGIAISGIALACGTRAGTANTASPVNCPYNVLATITNPRAVIYDVYYRDPSRPAVIIGEISPGATVTFPLPGEGRGRVYVRRPPGDPTPERTGNPGRPLPEIRIRVHCAGT